MQKNIYNCIYKKIDIIKKGSVQIKRVRDDTYKTKREEEEKSNRKAKRGLIK